MKLYNVTVQDYYEASYEGRIDTSYTILTIAENEDSAIDFVNALFENLSDDNRKATSAIEVNSSKAKNKRRAQLF